MRAMRTAHIHVAHIHVAHIHVAHIHVLVLCSHLEGVNSCSRVEVTLIVALIVALIKHVSLMRLPAFAASNANPKARLCLDRLKNQRA